MDVPAGVTQEEGHTRFLIHLLSAVHDALTFLARRIHTSVFVFVFFHYIFLFTQVPILVWFDGTIIDISTIVVTMYYNGYVGL